MGECRTGNKWSMFPTDAYLLFGRTWEWAELDACTMRIRKMGKRGRWLTRHSIMAKERVKEEDDEMREV